MADLNKALIKILKNEGGYSNDKSDKGGETYKGISRVNWPKWLGWKFIDFAKTKEGFPESLHSIYVLQDMVIAFYRINFWDKIKGNDIRNQDIAEMLVDSAVNEGIIPAVKRAQKITGIPITGQIDDLLISKLNNL
jgi:lysozyme family protein